MTLVRRGGNPQPKRAMRILFDQGTPEPLIPFPPKSQDYDGEGCRVGQAGKKLNGTGSSVIAPCGVDRLSTPSWRLGGPRRAATEPLVIWPETCLVRSLRLRHRLR